MNHRNDQPNFVSNPTQCLAGHSIQTNLLLLMAPNRVPLIAISNTDAN